MSVRILVFSFIFICGSVTLSAVFSQSQKPLAQKPLAQKPLAQKPLAQKPLADDAKLRERALKLHREAIVIDTHNDITSAITDRGFDMGERDTSGRNQTDIPRMKEGGLDADFFAIYVA